MPVFTRVRRVLVAGGAVAAFGVAMAVPASSVTVRPAMTVDPTTTVSTSVHGGAVTVSGSGCGAGGATIFLTMDHGAYGPDDDPPHSAELPFGNSVEPDSAGDWSGDLSIVTGLDPGPYTVQAECVLVGHIDFFYANVVITVVDTETTEPTDPTTTEATVPTDPTSTVPGATTTTAAVTTSTTSTAAAAAAVNTTPVVTG